MLLFRIRFTISLFLLNFFLGSAPLQAQLPDCNCEKILEEVIQKVEANYIGLALRKSKAAAAEYAANKFKYQSLVKKNRNNNSIACSTLIQEFLSFFEDGHLFIINRPQYDHHQLKDIERYRLKQQIDLHTLMNTQSTEKEDITGYWVNGKSEFKIIRQNDQYQAYRIASKIDSLKTNLLIASLKSNKAGFEGIYYQEDSSPLFVYVSQYKDQQMLNFSSGEMWMRKNAIYQDSLNTIDSNDVRLPTIRPINQETTLFTIPSFAIDFNVFIEFLKAKESILLNTKTLIIDIRGNTGGNGLYFAFIDLYAHKPLKSSQGLVLASDDTEEYFEWFTKRSPEVYQPVLDRLRAHKGEIVDGPLYPPQDYGQTSSSVKRVAILTDQGNMSASESFIIHSRALSDKVTVFGKPTAGVIDYTSVYTVKILASKEHNLLLGYPTSTLHKDIPKNGYNQDGIQPDVIIPDKEVDKIKFIQSYFEKN